MNPSEQELLCEIIRSAEMGKESLISLMSKIDSDSLQSDITAQINGYGSFINRADVELSSSGADESKVKSNSVLKKAAAKTGMAAETMFDSSPSKIAEMVIRGSGAGIIAVSRAYNNTVHKKNSVPASAVASGLAVEMVDFEHSNIECMRKYL